MAIHPFLQFDADPNTFEPSNLGWRDYAKLTGISRFDFFSQQNILDEIVAECSGRFSKYIKVFQQFSEDQMTYYVIDSNFTTSTEKNPHTTNLPPYVDVTITSTIFPRFLLETTSQDEIVATYFSDLDLRKRTQVAFSENRPAGDMIYHQLARRRIGADTILGLECMSQIRHICMDSWVNELAYRNMVVQEISSDFCSIFDNHVNVFAKEHR